MPTSVAAIRGKLGTTQYYIISMKVGELIRIVSIPSEDTEKWASTTIEEKYQRELNTNRVRKQIAPYLANDRDRFFGSLIVAVDNLDPNLFHPITRIANVPTAWSTSAESMGILDFKGGEVFIPLDGQHRLKALKFAIEGKDNKDKKFTNFSASPELANEDVVVILVPHDNKKSRRIFTKVNSYAKPPTKGQNLVTNDDSIFAVTARKVANEVIGVDLVKYDGASLSPKDPHFTTLTTIADCNEVILRGVFSSDQFDRDNAVVDIVQKKMYLDKVDKVWKHLAKNIECFSLMLADKTKDGNEKRVTLRENYLLGKPIPQLCLFKVFVNLTTGDNYSLEKASDCLNKIDWRQDNTDLWEGLLISVKNTIIYKHKNIATDIIYYMCDGKKYLKANLLEDYKALFPSELKKNKLPSKV